MYAAEWPCCHDPLSFSLGTDDLLPRATTPLVGRRPPLSSLVSRTPSQAAARAPALTRRACAPRPLFASQHPRPDFSVLTEPPPENSSSTHIPPCTHICPHTHPTLAALHSLRRLSYTHPKGLLPVASLPPCTSTLSTFRFFASLVFPCLCSLDPDSCNLKHCQVPTEY